MKRYALIPLLTWACAQGDVEAGDGADAAVAAGSFDCSAPGATEGRCDGEILLFCFEGEERRLDCALVEAHCGLDPMGGIHRCLEGAPPDDPPPDDPPPDDPPPDDPPPDDPPPDDPPPDDPPPDPPPSSCAEVGDGRACDGDTVLVCRAGEPAGRTDCAANGLQCGVLPGGDVGCFDPDAPADPPPGDPPPEGLCGDVDIGSRCDGDFVVSCRERREESRFDCARESQNCEQLDAQWAGCVGQGNNNPPPPDDPPGEPCGDVPITGRCTGDLYEVCNLFEDEVVRVDCRLLAAQCRITDGLAGCVWQ